MITTNEVAAKIAAEQNGSGAQAIVESVFKQISDAAGSGAEGGAIHRLAPLSSSPPRKNFTSPLPRQLKTR